MSRQHPERDLQAAVFDLLRLNAVPGVRAHHNFNEGKRAMRTADFYARLGMRKGLADVEIVMPDNTVRYLELKAPKGRLTPDQRAFAAECLKWSTPYSVVTTTEEAASILHEWGCIAVNPLQSSVRRAA